MHDELRVPRATYRLQLHAGFTFRDAAAIVPYLAELGISHVYCSPYLKARRGSTHGYDVVDHQAFNPEIGSREDFEHLAATLAKHGMGQLADIVPNHMGIMGDDNAWWLDVLENGRASAYADFFDIDWQPPNAHLHNKVLVPVLGDHYGECLARGELVLRFEPGTGSFHVRYFGHRFPLDPRTYGSLLEAASRRLEEGSSAQAPRLRALAGAFRSLPHRDEVTQDDLASRQSGQQLCKAQLAELAREPASALAIESVVARISGGEGDYDPLHRLLEEQAFRLAYWRVASDEINYRRFFDINELAALRMENDAAFDAAHALVLELVRRGSVHGLRIDHPDGLFDPAAYFERLQARCRQATDGQPFYVVCEKIIAPFEDLPADWAVAGTTGYRFANLVNGLFVDKAAEKRFTRAYAGFTGRTEAFEAVARRSKELVLRSALASELTVLAGRLHAIAQAGRATRDYTLNTLRQALGEVIAAFPVYRTYVGEQASSEDRRYIEWAIASARRHGRAMEPGTYDFIGQVLLGETAGMDAAVAGQARMLARKFQQVTAPVMAKGVEDTAFYVYNRLLSLNDVGGDPSEFGVSIKAFHGASADRAARWPRTLLATSTHDNKRSEDVRARLDVLTESPAAWRLQLRRWSRMNRSKKRTLGGEVAPSANDEYLIYQTLLGCLPCGEIPAEFRERVTAYALKAAREAKEHTSWVNPGEAYEQALAGFVQDILDAPGRNLFLEDMRQAADDVGWYGALNGLSLVLLKLTSPGIPDIYQGNELVDLSLVDPDNRRPVDYGRRRALLTEISGGDGSLGGLQRAWLRSPGDGRAKLFLTWKLLSLRRRQPALFRDGDYLPLGVKGERAGHVVAYARRHQGHGILVIAGRLFTRLAPVGTLPCGSAAWGDTRVLVPFLERGARLTDWVTGRGMEHEGAGLTMELAWSEFPGAVLQFDAGTRP